MKRFLIQFAAITLLASLGWAQTADEVIAKAIAARGGMDKIKAIQTVRLTAKIAFGSQGEGILTVEMKRPAKIREELTAGGRTVIRTSDGKAGWELNQFTGKNAPEPLAAAELNTMDQKADFDRPFVDYKAKGHKVELLATNTLQQGIQSRPPRAPIGATDTLVAVDGHHGPPKPSSGLLERL